MFPRAEEESSLSELQEVPADHIAPFTISMRIIETMEMNILT